MLGYCGVAVERGGGKGYCKEFFMSFDTSGHGKLYKDVVNSPIMGPAFSAIDSFLDTDPTAIPRMINASIKGRPALEGILMEIHSIPTVNTFFSGPPSQHDVNRFKKAVGELIRQYMVKNGWNTVKDIPIPDCQFKNAMLYTKNTGKNITLRDCIKDIILEIRDYSDAKYEDKERYFDAHTVIYKLIQEHHALYTPRNETLRSYNQYISTEIATFEGTLIERVGRSFSYAITANCRPCMCWRILRNGKSKDSKNAIDDARKAILIEFLCEKKIYELTSGTPHTGRGRSMVYAPQINPSTFLFFAWGPEAGSTTRDYSKSAVNNPIKTKRPTVVAEPLIKREFHAPFVATIEIKFWHEITLAMNELYCDVFVAGQS
jgi:hypothetical protein